MNKNKSKDLEKKDQDIVIQENDKTIDIQEDMLTQSGETNFIDPETGEMVKVDQITKITYGSKSFWKCYLIDFLNVLGVFDSKQVDIFIYIVENTNPSNNLFVGTYKKIARDLNVSEPTIAKIIKKLLSNGFLKRVQNGVLFVNPKILMKGRENKRQILLTYYQSPTPINQLTYSRTKRKQIKEKIDEPISKKLPLPGGDDEE